MREAVRERRLAHLLEALLLFVNQLSGERVGCRFFAGPARWEVRASGRSAHRGVISALVHVHLACTLHGTLRAHLVAVCSRATVCLGAGLWTSAAFFLDVCVPDTAFASTATTAAKTSARSVAVIASVRRQVSLQRPSRDLDAPPKSRLPRRRRRETDRQQRTRGHARRPSMYSPAAGASWLAQFTSRPRPSARE